jgi:hypothetical protein
MKPNSPMTAVHTTHEYEVRPRKDQRGVDLISEQLLFGCLRYAGPNAVTNAIGYATYYSRSHDVVIRVYDAAGNVIETHETQGRVQRVVVASETQSRHAVKAWRLISPNRSTERPHWQHGRTFDGSIHIVAELGSPMAYPGPGSSFTTTLYA